MPSFPADIDAPVAVMDGECALCCFGARMIHRLDTDGHIRIARIQTPVGQQLLKQHGLDPIDPSSWLFIEHGHVWRDFDAMIRVGARCGGWGRALSVLRILPGPVRRWIYHLIARNRYRVFGSRDMCSLPDKGLRDRLMS